MNIGEKLRRLRTEAGLTQDAVAEAVGVSRQTLSSWENDKSLPDARGIALLSDLSDVSVASLIGEDVNTAKEAYQQQQSATCRKRLYKSLQIVFYIVLWGILLTLFWIGGNMTHVLFSVMMIYGLMPVLTIIFGAWLGADELWKWGKWLFLVIGGATNAMWYGLTYGLANVLAHNKSFAEWLEYSFEPKRFFVGAALAAAGIMLGIVLKNIKRVAVRKQVQ